MNRKVGTRVKVKNINQPLTSQQVQIIDQVIQGYNGEHSRLLEILLEIQSLMEGQYISKAVAYYIAENMGLHASRIYDVISFFSALSEKPRAKYPIQVCESIVCKVNESDNLLNNLQLLLGIDLNEVTYDGKYTIEEVPCFGACDKAPAMRINGKVYGPLHTKEQIKAVLSELE